MVHKIYTCDFGDKSNNTCGSFLAKTMDGRWICNICYYGNPRPLLTSECFKYKKPCVILVA